MVNAVTCSASQSPNVIGMLPIKMFFFCKGKRDALQCIIVTVTTTTTTTTTTIIIIITVY